MAAWAKQAGKTGQLLALAQGSGFYCYVRSLLGREPNMNLIAAEAAQALGQPAEALKWLSHHAQQQARIGNLTEVENHLPQMETWAKQASSASGSSSGLPLDVAEPYRHALASYYFARERFDEAEREWRSLLESSGLGEPAKLVTVKWLAECLRQRGHLSDAQILLERILSEHGEMNNPRASVALKLVLAKVFLAQGDVEAAGRLAAQCEDTINTNNIERHQPDVIFLRGSLAVAHGDLPQAHETYAEALMRFQQLGLRRETLEVEAALERLHAAT